MSCTAPGSSVHGNSQARILEWVAIPFSRGSFWPRDWTRVSWPTGTVVSVHGTDSQVSSAPILPAFGVRDPFPILILCIRVSRPSHYCYPGLDHCFGGSGGCPCFGGLPWASLVAQMVKNWPAIQETWVRSLAWEDPLEKQMATHSSIVAWENPWTEEPGRLQSMRSQRVRHDWATKHAHMPLLCINRIFNCISGSTN